MENPVDPGRLRTGRLERLQGTMRAQDVEACLLFNGPNVRYATGASATPIWSNTTFVRCALVPVEGRPILFEYPNAMHLFRGIEADVRPMHAWEFYDDTKSTRRSSPGRRSPRCGSSARRPPPDLRAARGVSRRAGLAPRAEGDDPARPHLPGSRREAPQLPPKFLPQRYEVMIHSIGLEEESPSVAYPDDPQPNGDRVLEENMALVVEL